MSLALNFNLSAVRANLNLMSVDRLLSQSIERLSSGERMRLAKDDPAGMVVANGLRHHLAGLNQAMQNIESGVTMVQTAEAGMDQVSAILVRIRSLALSAANDGVQNLPQRQALQSELDEAIKSISRIASDTQFGNLKLLNGNLADITLEAAAKDDYQSVTWDATRVPGGMQAGSTVSIIPPSSATLARERMQVTFVGTPAGSTAIQGSSQGGTVLDAVAGKTVTITGPNGHHTITLTATTSIDDFVAQVNAFTKTTGARALYDSTTGILAVESVNFGVGALSISSQDMTSGISTVGLMDTDTTDPKANPLHPQRDTYRMRLQTGAAAVPVASDMIQGLVDPTSTTTFDAVDGKTLTIFGRGTSATLTMSATTTIQDVVDWVNGQNAALGTWATYDALTGDLSIIGDGGPIRLTADTMSTGGNTVGLMDRDTTTINSTGPIGQDTRIASSANATIDMTFTDAAGIAHTVTLVQSPSATAATGNVAGGLTFVNLLPGPEQSGTDFTGWQSGAFSVTLNDTTDGHMGSPLTSPTATRTATRTSSTFIQSGGLAGQAVTVEVTDMRSGALGRSANLMSQGLSSLADLSSTQALVNGNAQNALAVIDAAIAEVSQARGRLGALQSNALDTANSALQIASQNLTESESYLRDTDFAAESAILTRNQIIYQAATAMLAQANQVPQTILEMLKR